MSRALIVLRWTRDYCSWRARSRFLASVFCYRLSLGLNQLKGLSSHRSPPSTSRRKTIHPRPQACLLFRCLVSGPQRHTDRLGNRAQLDYISKASSKICRPPPPVSLDDLTAELSLIVTVHSDPRALQDGISG
ncbi:hypothetical protein OE88DRAFT_218359 [Heliocybe sulcata]|uniref:Uncharacterized protein n=1 Tax=Heliocybe sulcata TaxID=5364 RepID=A0A5C3N215_9AGAM|nr:hypothetical protein OE88DRAFT_218359 [Heliocybe sulcata]